MNESIEALAGRLITPDMRNESALSVVNVVTQSPHHFRFRFSPDDVFERVGRIDQFPAGDLKLSVGQRYTPGESLTWLPSRPLVPDAERLAEDLGRLRAFGNWWEARPHWRDAASQHAPEWTFQIPVAASDAAGVTRDQSVRRAAETGRARFLWTSRDHLVCSDCPPPRGEIWSVNESGEWSAHTSRTRLLETPPPEGTFPRPVPADAVRLAAQDLSLWGQGLSAWGPAERPAQPGTAPVHGPAPDLPARRGR
jgi:hypothetical protein